MSGETGIFKMYVSSGTGSIRGMFLRPSTFQNITTDPETVIFDTVILDTDSIYDGTGGGVVPTGMAGVWEISSEVASFNPVGAYTMQWGGPGDYWQAYFQAASVAAADFVWTPQWFILAEGAHIYMNVIGGIGDSIQPDSWFLMKFLGPTP